MNQDTPLQTFPPHLAWLLAGLTLGWGLNWPIMKAVLLLGETPHWQDYAALVLVVTSLATVLMPAKPSSP